jgi:NADH-quinone oxidoreductase subunit C
MADQETPIQSPAPALEPWEAPAKAPEPHDARSQGQVAELEAAVPGCVAAAVELAGQVTVTVSADRILEVCRLAKETLGYRYLVDLTAVDWTNRAEGRFDVVYFMHRHRDEARLRLKVVVPEGAELPSVTGIWKTANWMEREVFDMFGLRFSGHPNLERILTWEGFSGYPLRKDFPILGVDTGAAIYPDTYPEGGGPVKPKGGAS